MMSQIFHAALVLALASHVTQADSWRVGDRVLASPAMMESSWQVCVVMALPKGLYDGYQLNCAKDPSRERSARTVPAKWIKAAPLSDVLTAAAPAPAQKPAMALRPSPPAPVNKAPKKPQAPTAGVAGADARSGGVAIGSYECWAFNSARGGLNFSILSGGRYKDSEGGIGSYTHDSATGRIAFVGAGLDGAMPTGFYAIYHEPKGHPTVSFRSARGSEASFCERAR